MKFDRSVVILVFYFIFETLSSSDELSETWSCPKCRYYKSNLKNQGFPPVLMHQDAGRSWGAMVAEKSGSHWACAKCVDVYIKTARENKKTECYCMELGCYKYVNIKTLEDRYQVAMRDELVNIVVGDTIAGLGIIFNAAATLIEKIRMKVNVPQMLDRGFMLSCLYLLLVQKSPLSVKGLFKPFLILNMFWGSWRFAKYLKQKIN